MIWYMSMVRKPKRAHAPRFIPQLKASDDVWVDFPKYTKKQLHYTMLAHDKEFRCHFQASDDVFVGFPNLTPEQNCRRQKAIAAQNKHDYVHAVAHKSPEEWARIRKKQWLNEKYRKYMTDAMNNGKASRMGKIGGKAIVPGIEENFGDRNKKEIECMQMMRKIGLNPIQFEKLDNKALDDLWWDLHQW